MTMRTVQIALATYTGADGVRRIGQQGEQVDVHPDDLARFAAVNGIIEVQAPAKKRATPKKRAAPRRK